MDGEEKFCMVVQWDPGGVVIGLPVLPGWGVRRAKTRCDGVDGKARNGAGGQGRVRLSQCTQPIDLVSGVTVNELSRNENQPPADISNWLTKGLLLIVCTIKYGQRDTL